MITIASVQSIGPRSALAIGAAALLCAGLGACSSAATPISAAARPAASHASLPAGASPAGSPVAAGGSACGLVTKGEVTKAMGKPMAAGKGTGDICVFSGTADKALLVYVQIYPDSAAMAVPKQNESGGEHLSGLGDDAFWTAAGTVFAQKGARGVGVSIPSPALP